MTHPRVICLGEILFDYLADQPGHSPKQVESWTPHAGGAPANVACALAKLGTPAGFIGCVGQDEPGDSLVRVLSGAGVGVTGIQRHKTAPTRAVYVLRSETGEREFAGFGERDTTEFADTYLQSDQLPEELFENAEFLVLGSLEMAYPDSRKAIERAIDLAEQHYVKIVLDVNWRPAFWPDPADAPQLILDLLPQVDFLKLSEEEAEWLLGATDASSISYKLDSVEGVLITAGEHGCSYCLGDTCSQVPAFPVKVADTTGAGDAFLAGFVHQICQHGISILEDPQMAKKVVTYACAVGSLTATKPGAIAGAPDAGEVEAFLHSSAVH
ncbi:carbohydrate kinase family protein [Kamptonema formosum]|uniref:carbohydrate kinase family protein n=1 Tax=Kamptonema formosum TaxID=331992 RepID=UPI0003654568|nr:carbohydrate kinase [Oscillatoria sp. PCC 10802]